MKFIFTFLFFITSCALFSQSNDVVGDYLFKVTTKNNEVFDYKLTLSKDGTFTFHSYSYIKNRIPSEDNKYAKGKWTEKNNVITFSSNKQEDFDEKNTLDFTNSKARFITKSPRDKTDQVIITRLKFLSSELFWIARIDMNKM